MIYYYDYVDNVKAAVIKGRSTQFLVFSLKNKV